MKREITLRCFAERRRESGRWYVHCIDLCLDAEGESYAEGRGKLDDAIILYLDWALAQRPRRVSEILRTSPLEFRLRYCRAWAKERVAGLRDAVLRRRLSPATPERQYVTHPDMMGRARGRVPVAV